MVFITVFTPTYNRGYTLEKLYNSLKAQTYRDFEWLVTDDGSTDNTRQLFENWAKADNGFAIRYYYTENGGKHRAINKAAELAEGKLFFIADSDDYLTDDALERIKYWESTISDKKDFAGVAGLRGHENGKMIGTTFKPEYVDATSLERKKHNIKGDKAEVFYTDILKKYKFPEFEGEKFVTECVVWNAIADGGYKLRWFNEIIYLCEYLPDGLTKNIESITFSNPKGHLYYINTHLKFRQVSITDKLRMTGGLLKNRKRLGTSIKEISEDTGLSILLLFVILCLSKVYYRLKKIVVKLRRPKCGKA